MNFMGHKILKEASYSIMVSEISQNIYAGRNSSNAVLSILDNFRPTLY